MNKIAIVGPELSKWKSKEQIEKVKAEIKCILLNHIDCWESLRYPSYPDNIKSVVLVSGHCPKGGVDIWAEEIADELGIKKEIYPAEVNQWEDYYVFKGGNTYRKGYKSRNIQIAEVCDVLYCIVPKRDNKLPYPEWIKSGKDNWCIHCGGYSDHPTNGGCWTMKYAKKLGKETHLVVIE